MILLPRGNSGQMFLLTEDLFTENSALQLRMIKPKRISVLVSG